MSAFLLTDFPCSPILLTMRTKREPQTVPCRYCKGLGRRLNDRYYGPLMRKRREAGKVSLRAVARQLAVSASYLSDLETGRRHLNDEMMQRIEDGIAALGKGKK